MARIFDNIDSSFTEGLRGIVGNAGVTRTDFCVGYFNLRGWGVIADLIDKLPGDYVYEDCDGQDHFRYCRLLIGMQKPDEDLIYSLYAAKEGKPVDSEQVQIAKRRTVEAFRRQLMLGVPTDADEKALKDLIRQLKEGRVVVKLYLKTQLHAKLYLAYRPGDSFNPIMPLMGSSNLTYSGLKGQGELDTEIGDSTNALILRKWFEDRWDERFCIDITDDLIRVLEESWAGDTTIPPYQIYIKTAYHLSSDARTGISEYNLPPVFKNQLFEFQQNAVKIAAQNLEKRGGTMIGDVVGLGKTITACAVAKVYEMRHGNNTTIIPMLNNEFLQHIYETEQGLPIESFEDKTGKQLVYKKIAYNWLAISNDEPPAFDKNGRNISQTMIGQVRYKSKYYEVILLLSVGKFMFSRWMTYGDDFHLSAKDFSVQHFPFERLSSNDLHVIKSLFQQFVLRLPDTVQFKLNAGKRVGTYNTRKLWDITDQSDLLFLKYLTDNPIRAFQEIENHIAVSVLTELGDEE